MRRPAAVVELSALRLPAAAMLAAGAALPWLGHPGVACPLRTATGIPCPLCGLSTSVQETVRGDFASALAANPGGLLLVALALWALLGRRARAFPVPGVAIGAALVGSWVFQLFRFSVL